MQMEPGTTPRSGKESLSALRDHVSRAVDEIVRLRAQNAALVRRLSKVESGTEGTAINLAGATDPEEFRATVTGFVDSIDRYLAAGSENHQDEE
jgi:hypothetical protein